MPLDGVSVNCCGQSSLPWFWKSRRLRRFIVKQLFLVTGGWGRRDEVTGEMRRCLSSRPRLIERPRKQKAGRGGCERMWGEVVELSVGGRQVGVGKDEA
jgi:hypothetical protein